MAGMETIVKALLANLDLSELANQVKPMLDGFLTELRKIIREENERNAEQIRLMLTNAEKERNGQSAQ